MQKGKSITNLIYQWFKGDAQTIIYLWGCPYKSLRYNGGCIMKIKIPLIRTNITNWSKSKERA